MFRFVGIFVTLILKAQQNKQANTYLKIHALSEVTPRLNHYF